MTPAWEGSDPFNYTGGRWLRQNALEVKSRNIKFDFDALRRRVVALCPGASSIISYSKQEGSFNRVFTFHTDNAKRVVARLPFPVAGPQRLITNSEVATIQFLQKNTSIPIPKVLEWNDDPNIIGSEYIIMEHAPGVPLREKWKTMSMEKRLQFILAIGKMSQELAALDFLAYGSLYFADTPYISQLIPFNQEVSIGPHCGCTYWNCTVGQPRYFHDVKPNQGPWLNLAAYSDNLTDTGISRLPPVDPSTPRPRYHGSVQTHRKLLEQGRAVLRKMATDSLVEKAAVPAIFHPDLHQRNIFVSEDDPSVISAIIDWQSTSIQPAFWYAYETPDFAERRPDSSDERSSEPKSEACAEAYIACLKVLAPKLGIARQMDARLFRPFHYIYRTWNDGAIGLREVLISLSLAWKELGLTDSCPFPQPTPEELKRHKEDFKLYDRATELRLTISQVINSTTDGLVPSECWEEAKSGQREAFETIMRLLKEQQIDEPDDDDPLKSEDDLREIWPFDLEEEAEEEEEDLVHA